MTERIQWKLVDHISIPGMILIQGPAFPLAICTQATDITFPDYLRIMANARLIAAAPEMLDCLHTARTLLSTVAVAASWNDDTIKQLVPECRAFMAASNKLLDKIEGGGE